MSYKIEVIFKRKLSDVIRNVFAKKAKRCPRVATFEVATYGDYEITDGGLRVTFGNVHYVYPAHIIERIKIS